ncbi:MAG: hypothetical protein ACI90M_004235, partial [Candidatus Azotimanducaceae bacterium]
ALSGERAGQRDVRVGRGTRDEPFVKGPLCADFDGFSLHGAVRVAGCVISACDGGSGGGCRVAVGEWSA